MSAEWVPDPGAVLSSQGTRKELLLHNHQPFKQAYWKFLHFSGFVLLKPKGEQSNFKSKDSPFEDRSPFMFYFTSSKVNPFCLSCNKAWKATVPWHRVFKCLAKSTPFSPARASLCKNLCSGCCCAVVLGLK